MLSRILDQVNLFNEKAPPSWIFLIHYLNYLKKKPKNWKQEKRVHIDDGNSRLLSDSCFDKKRKKKNAVDERGRIEQVHFAGKGTARPSFSSHTHTHVREWNSVSGFVFSHFFYLFFYFLFLFLNAISRVIGTSRLNFFVLLWTEDYTRDLRQVPKVTLYMHRCACRRFQTENSFQTKNVGSK